MASIYNGEAGWFKGFRRVIGLWWRLRRKIKKTFTTGLSPDGKQANRPAGEGKALPLARFVGLPRKRWQNKARETTIS